MFNQLLRVQHVQHVQSGQLGSRSRPQNHLLLFFPPLYRNSRGNDGGKKEKSGIVKKICLPGIDKLTRAVDRKPNYF